jgi:hypothetical protein
VKSEEEARIQYTELASALEQVDASWIVVEVEELIARGKTVLFRELSEEDAVLYESRLQQESLIGLPIGRARADDSIGVPYSAYEQLSLLVAAAERVIMISEYSIANISSFAARLGISAIRLESPVDPYATSAAASEMRSIPLAPPPLVGERLSILHNVLYSEVLG